MCKYMSIIIMLGVQTSAFYLWSQKFENARDFLKQQDWEA